MINIPIGNYKIYLNLKCKIKRRILITFLILRDLNNLSIFLFIDIYN